MKLLAVICVIASCSYLTTAGHHKKPCEDTLSAQSYLIVNLPTGDKVNLTDCADLVKDYLPLCKTTGKKVCCKSCSEQDLKCIDSLKYFRNKPSDALERCDVYIPANPCKCKDRRIKKDCCHSCSKVGDLSMCDCMDLLSDDNVLKFKNSKNETLEVKSCDDLIRDYSSLCKDNKVGGKKGACCKSCSELCEDSATYRKTVKAKNAAGKKEKCKKCSCSEIKAKGASFVAAACKNKKVKQNCCAMCSA